MNFLFCFFFSNSPKYWTEAIITPVTKHAKDETDQNNFRPYTWQVVYIKHLKDWYLNERLVWYLQSQN